MALHESSVNFQNLIRDLADMYPLEVPEVVVIELVANALDAGATRISLDYQPNKKVLTVADNGTGMSEKQFDEYHDFAAGLKTRGSGIGFAGVGAKISFNIANRVVTKTRSSTFDGGSNWFLKSKKKLIWEDIDTSDLDSVGTKVEVHFGKDIPEYSKSNKLINMLRRNYLPLFDRKFLELYSQLGFYSENLCFVVNGKSIKAAEVDSELALEKKKEIFPLGRGKNLIGYGFLGLSSIEYPLEPNICGVLLCTHGKVIKQDLFNQFPGSLGPQLIGLVEIPGFIDFLTTSKTDFFRGRGRNKKFESIYGPVREEFKEWLSELGVKTTEISETDDARKLENELKKILEDVPELSEFFGFRHPSSVLSHNDTGQAAEMAEGIDVAFPNGIGVKGNENGLVDEGEEPGNSLAEKEDGIERAKPISRSSRRGPKISFAKAPEKTEIAWVDGNSVIINSAHPSYMKASADNLAKRVFCLFAIGSAVQRFLSDPDSSLDTTFVDRLMAAWGSK